MKVKRNISCLLALVLVILAISCSSDDVSMDKGQSWERVNHEFQVAGWEDVLFINNTKLLAVGFSGRSISVEITQ